MTPELLNKTDDFLKRSHRYGFVYSLTKIQPLLDSAMETSLERYSLTAFIPSCHQTDLSVIYSGPEVMILSLPCINDLLSVTYVLPIIVICLHIRLLCASKGCLLTNLLTYLLRVIFLYEC